MAQNELVMSKAATEDMIPAPQQVAAQGQAEMQTETTGPLQSGNEESANVDAPMSMDYATNQSSSEAPAANGHLPTLPDVNLDPGQMGTDTVASATNDEASTNAAALAGMTNAHADDMTNMTNDQSASDGHEAASSESDANATGQGFVVPDDAALSQTNMSLGNSAAPIAAGMTSEPQPNSDNAVVNAEAAASQDQSVDTKDDEKITPPAPTTNATEGQIIASEAPDEPATASAIRTADSDIEEGEELSSPPRPAAREINTEQSSYSQSRRSPSPTASSRHQRSRDGRSRSPGRQRRPSPVRDGETKPSIDRSELFKVYVGGLPEKTEFADLQDCFSQFGEIGHIELKLGYAFIEFVTQEGAAGAIETYNEGHFLGKMIKVEASKSATTQQKSIDEGTCFTCGQHGHFAKYCPQDPRNAHRTARRHPPRDRSPGRDRRDYRDRDRDRDGAFRDRDRPPRRDREWDRDDSRRFPPRDRDDRREHDRRRDRDGRNFDGPAPGGRYIEPHTRDSHRNQARSLDPVAARERELLDQQRDRERQLRRLAETDPQFVHPPMPPGGGYPPRGSTDSNAYPPRGGPPPAGSPYYPPYGTQAFPPPPPAGLPVGSPYGMPSSMPGPSASPPLPAYPPRGEQRGDYNAQSYPPTLSAYSHDNDRPAEPYYRSHDIPFPPRDTQNGNYGHRDEDFGRRESFGHGGERYGAPLRTPYPAAEVTPYPRRGEDRQALGSSMPPSGAPPFYYDRPPHAWSEPAGGSDRPPSNGPPFDNYGRPGTQPYQHAPAHEYDSYRPGR